MDHREGSAPILEREIERLRARVAQLEREKADIEAFAGLAAHELLQPLVKTESYAALIGERLEEPWHADSRGDLQQLGIDVARTRRLIETLLEDARAGGRPLRRRPVDLTAVLQECLALLAPEIEARGARVEVGALPEVAGDVALLSGVFTNLLLNALKYSPRRPGTILVGAAREPAGWRFSVQSEGPTIPLDDRRRIFEPYHRGRGERRAHGSGLGLAICRRIVERHGGEIGVGAGDRGGNRFYFTLPADAAFQA